MHIVYITREYPPTLRGGGIAAYVRGMARAFLRAGHQVSVICASDDTRMSAEESDGGIRVIRLAGGDFVIPAIEGSSLCKKFRMFYRFHSYRRSVQRALELLENVDIIEVAEYGAEALYLLDKTRPVIVRLHCPMALSLDNQKPKRFRGLHRPWQWLSSHERTLVNHADFVSSCSQGLADWVVRYFGTVAERVTTIYNPVNLDNWPYAPCETSNSSILYFGTVAEGKGVGDLLEAAKILRARGQGVQLTLAGKLGAYGEQLRMSACGESWCQFLGQVNAARLRELFRSHSVVCLPSWWENLPMACLEAMACGCIVVGSSCGGMSEIITDGVDGYLCAPRNSEQLAQCLSKALTMRPTERTSMSYRARARVETAFSMQVIIPRMLSYYQQAINLYHS